MSTNNSFFAITPNKLLPDKTPDAAAEFGPGDLGWFPYSPHEPAQLSDAARRAIQQLTDDFSNKDIAARRWEVEQPLDIRTPVPTPSGWKLQGDLVPGDYVFDDRGVITRVSAVHPIRVLGSYTLRFSDGSDITAAFNHPWDTTTASERGHSRGGRTRTTSEIAASVDQRHAIALSPGFELPEAALPVPPYVLGCWLGDGIKNSGSVCGNRADLQEIAESEGWGPLKPSPGGAHGKNLCTVLIPGLQTALRALGVLNKKRIPPIYLRASRDQRIALLQGLMDTDGWVTSDKGACGWGQGGPNSGLLGDFSELLATLGIKHRFILYVREREGRTFEFRQTSFSAPFHCFRLARKRGAQSLCATPRTRVLMVESAEFVGERAVRCITVEAPSHLYLVGNKAIVTHNSWEAQLFNRGYQYLIPRRGGGWVYPPFATTYNRGSARKTRKAFGYETNIYAAYGDIVAAALTRDVPHVRFEPSDPRCDADITAAQAANKYARLFASNNDLLQLQQQVAWYLWNDGRVVTCTDHIIDAQKYGRDPLPGSQSEAVVPETSNNLPVFAYFVRHGATELNVEGKPRGRSEAPLAPIGEDEAFRAASFLRGKHVSALFASPVERASESAQIAAKLTGLTPDFDPRLASLNIGPAESSPPSLREAFDDHPDEPIGGTGETPNEFSARVRAFLADLIQSRPQGGQNGAAPGPVAVVTHDSVIRQVYEAAGGDLEPEVSPLPPGGVAALTLEPDGSLSIRQVYPGISPSQTESSRRGRPRGVERIKAYGKLQAKVPMEAQDIEGCGIIQISEEFDYALLRGIFPDKANEINPGGSGGGENELDRIARINVGLALEASYVTGDSMVRSTTYQRTWMRPSQFFSVADPAVRQELLDAFPDGALVVYCGQAFIFARNERMDDHLTMIQAFPGAGMNRRALGTNLITIQKRLNNWMDLLNDFFLRTVPQRYIDNRAFNIEAIAEQNSAPGDYIPFDRSAVPPGMSAKDLIFVEDTPQPQPSMPQYIQLMFGEFSQLLSGGLPTLFGAYANTDTVGAVSIQRDQALARLGTTWHNINTAAARYFHQAVRLAAQCRQSEVVGSLETGQRIQIEIADLRGNVLAYPEEDANFPESWTQKQQRVQQLLQDAGNPFVASMLQTPNNLRVARNAIGLTDFLVPAAESYDKQQGEFELLLKGEPLPNPAVEEAQEQAATLALEAERTGDPQLVQAAEMAASKIKEIPPLVSTVPVDPEIDDNAAEAQACLDFLRSAEGRRLKYGSPASRGAYANVRLHMMEHKQAAEQLARSQPALKKPPTISIPFKDLPANAGAELLDRMGLNADPQDVASEREAAAIEKRASKGRPSPPAN